MDSSVIIGEMLDCLGVKAAEFARSIGVVPTQIYDLQKGKIKKISDSIADKIISAYPEFDKVWLLTGEGSMLKSSPESKESGATKCEIREGDYSGTLVYNIDATCGTDLREMAFTQENVIGSVDLPGISKDSKIIRANGDSMEPRIYDGNMVVIREIHNWEDVFYGQIYLILLDEYRMIKYIRRYEPDETNYIILRSENAAYDDIKLRKDKIRRLFIVENILSVRTQL